MKDETPSLESVSKEVDMWRNHFLEEAFSGVFQFVPEDHKSELRIHFMSIPSEWFTSPWEEWNKCVSVLLQGLRRKQND